MKYHFRVRHKSEAGYWAECIEIKGCKSLSDSLEELKENLPEVLNQFLDQPVPSNYIFPEPDKALNKNPQFISVPVEETIAFALLLRKMRIEKKLTQKEMQHAMNLPSKNSYVRLEKRGNPTLETISRVIQTFPDFDISDVLNR